jgi:hypothetical protein
MHHPVWSRFGSRARVPVGQRQKHRLTRALRPYNGCGEANNRKKRLRGDLLPLHAQSARPAVEVAAQNSAGQARRGEDR